jgi:hypothetical protein
MAMNAKPLAMNAKPMALRTFEQCQRTNQASALVRHSIAGFRQRVDASQLTR